MLAIPIDVEPIPIDMDAILFADTFSPRALDGAVDDGGSVTGDDILDFNDPEWDTLFDNFDNFEEEETLVNKKNLLEDKDDPFPFLPSKVEKRKLEDERNDILPATKCFRLSGNVKPSLVPIEPPAVTADNISLNLFAAPRYTWPPAKQKRFNAMQRLQAKKRSGRFGIKKNKAYTVRKNLANRRKRTKKGQFARTTKYQWVSACDL